MDLVWIPRAPQSRDLLSLDKLSCNRFLAWQNFISYLFSVAREGGKVDNVMANGTASRPLSSPLTFFSSLKAAALHTSPTQSVEPRDLQLFRDRLARAEVPAHASSSLAMSMPGFTVKRAYRILSGVQKGTIQSLIHSCRDVPG